MLAAAVSLLWPQNSQPLVDTQAAMPALLVRGAADERMQEELFAALTAVVREQPQKPSRSSATPLCVFRHPYSDQTNADAKPQAVFDWAHGLAAHVAYELRQRKGEALAGAADAIDHAKYDSLVSVCYAREGTLPTHVDKGLSGYGLALSLGAACQFDYGGSQVELHSGDALFADFSRIQHSVLATRSVEATAPTWWGHADVERRYGAARCSVQLRDRVWSLKPSMERPGTFTRRTVRRPT